MTIPPDHPHQRYALDPAAPPLTPKVREALDARDALAAALTRAGIQLPAMDLRTYWAEDGKEGSRYALIYLGACSAPVAHALAEAITKGLPR